MSHLRLSRFLKAKSPLVTLAGVAPLVVAILSLTACVKYPVGDPEKSKVDPKLSGVWCYQQADSKTPAGHARHFLQEPHLVLHETQCGY